jgi:hypothetical protein
VGCQLCAQALVVQPRTLNSAAPKTTRDVVRFITLLSSFVEQGV